MISIRPVAGSSGNLERLVPSGDSDSLPEGATAIAPSLVSLSIEYATASGLGGSIARLKKVSTESSVIEQVFKHVASRAVL